ncbi:MAG: hypothetical protein KC933_18305 [Myxococcales bacterium]|nr:hypothetical protein [Myxococcales bacterium]
MNTTQPRILWTTIAALLFAAGCGSDAPLQITTTSLPNGVRGTAYTTTLTASGGTGEGYTWSTVGTLPAGLALDASGTPGAKLAGTPTEAGAFELTVRATDAEGTTADKTLMLTVRPGQPLITTESLAPGLVGERYELRLEAQDGEAPYSWSVASGTVAPGLTLQDDGLLFGTPTTAGEYALGVKVTDARGNTDERGYTVLIVEPLAITTRTLPLAVIDEPYSARVEATGGIEPYTFFLQDTLPGGISFSSEGVFSGTPTEQGEWGLTVRVQDALQGVPRSVRLILRVQDVRQYEVTPNLAFPPLCTTSTHVSYQTVEINIPDSFAIGTIEIAVDVDFTDTNGGDNGRLKLVLFAPDGRRTVLCGNGAGVRGSDGCSGSNGIHQVYGGAVSPEVPLRVFAGMNAQGTWRFQAAVVKPSRSGGNCAQAGLIRRVALTMEPDFLGDPYIIVTGFTRNNLMIEPWIRITGFGGLDQHDAYLAATLWSTGANGRREGGMGDDQPMPNTFTWTASGLPPGTTMTPDGHAHAGQVTSRGHASYITATDDTGAYSVTLPLHVTPPDWNSLIRSY